MPSRAPIFGRQKPAQRPTAIAGGLDPDAGDYLFVLAEAAAREIDDTSAAEAIVEGFEASRTGMLANETVRIAGKLAVTEAVTLADKIAAYEAIEWL